MPTGCDSNPPCEEDDHPRLVASEDVPSSKERAMRARRTSLHRKVFVDAKDMKEQLKKNIHKERYDVANFYFKEGLCQQVARNPVFENITLGVIAINALWISIDADLNNEDVLVEAHPVFIIAENLFCSYFTVEICFRLGAFQHKRNCLKDAWFCFDFTMVGLMIFETWVMTIVFFAMGGGSGVNLGSAAMIKMLRLLRLSRMARMARLLRSMPEIVILIKGMVSAIRSVTFTLLLLVLLLYIFAVIFKQLAADTPTGEEYFSTVPRSMNMLIIHGVFFDAFGEIVASIVAEDWAVPLLFLFYLFVMLASLTVMNMLIGILCEVISAVAEAEHEQLTMNYLKDSLWVIVEAKLEEKELADNVSKAMQAGTGGTEAVAAQKTVSCAALEDSDGRSSVRLATETIISKLFFSQLMEDKETAMLLKDVEVDVVELVDLVDTIFSSDTGEERTLTFPEVVQAMLEHRSNSKATIKDITDLRRYVRTRIDRMDADVGDRIRAMQAHVDAIGKLMEQLVGLDEGSVDEQAAQGFEKLKAEHVRKIKSEARRREAPKAPPPAPTPEASAQLSAAKIWAAHTSSTIPRLVMESE